MKAQQRETDAKTKAAQAKAVQDNLENPFKTRYVVNLSKGGDATEKGRMQQLASAFETRMRDTKNLDGPEALERGDDGT